MPRRYLRSLLLPLLLLALPAQPANQTGVLTATRNLALGRFIAASGGSVTVSPDGVRSKSGSLLLLPGGTVTSAAFSLTTTGNGKALRWTTITLPVSATLIRGGASMNLVNFTSNPPGTFGGSALTELTVGATLNVGANQAAGDYTGTFTVTVNYE